MRFVTVKGWRPTHLTLAIHTIQTFIKHNPKPERLVVPAKALGTFGISLPDSGSFYLDGVEIVVVQT